MVKTLKLATAFSRLLYLLLSLSVLVAVSYFFAYQLIGSPLNGPDNRMNLDYILWLDKYFPHIPQWWPAEGGGTSFVAGYPILYHLTVIVSHKIIPSLSLTAWMGIWNFLAILLTSFGIYFLTWRILKNQTAALIAGFFYHLSPLSYILIAKWGFLTHAFSIIFVPYSLLFFDIFCQQRKEKSRWAPLSLLLTGLFLVAVFVAHPISGIGTFITLGFWTISESFLIHGFSKKSLASLINKTISLIIVSLTFLLLAVFYFFPFYQFTNFSNRGTDPSILMETKNLTPVSIGATLGFQKFAELWDFAIAIPVWGLALLGGIFSWGFKRKAFAFTLLAFLTLGLLSQNSIYILINKIWPLIGLFFNARYFWSSAIIFAPVAGAIGVYSLGRLLLFPLEIISKRLSGRRVLLLKIPHSLALTVFLIIGSGLIIYLTNFSNLADPRYQAKDILHYGVDFNGFSLVSPWNRPPDNYCLPNSDQYSELCENTLFQKYFDVTTFIKGCRDLNEAKRFSEEKMPDICKILEIYQLELIPEKRLSFWRNQCLDKKLPPEYNVFCLSAYANLANFQEQLAFVFPPKLTLDDNCYNVSDDLEMAHLYKNNRQFIDQSRLYVQGYTGWNYCWPIKHQTSFLNLYTSQLYLNKPYMSFFGDIINNQSEVNYQTKINNLSQWFGMDAILDKLSDPNSPDIFQDPFWQRAKEEKFVFYRSVEPVGLASLRFAPRVLVIGSTSKRAYEQFFRLAGLGGFYYQNGTLIEGKGRVDDYSLEELKRFNLLILSGHDYRNRDKAWRLLSNYVQQGGTVFLDSGWQYVAADWGITKLADGETFVTDYPDPSPVKKTTWGDIGTSWAGASLELEGINLSQFALPSWENQPWGMAVAQMADLTEGAKPILSKGNKVIIAQRNYGQGKIIWSGMNLIAHAYDRKNSEEILFLNKILTSLVKPTATDINQLWPQRENPDQPIFTLTQATNQPTLLYFREAYHPFWQANLVQGNQKKKLEIYSAGPQFMAVILPSLNQNDQVLFRFSTFPRYYLYYLISLATFLALIILILDSIFWQGKLLKLILDKIRIGPTRLTKKITKIREDFYKDEDY